MKFLIELALISKTCYTVMILHTIAALMILHTIAALCSIFRSLSKNKVRSLSNLNDRKILSLSKNKALEQIHTH